MLSFFNGVKGVITEAIKDFKTDAKMVEFERRLRNNYHADLKTLKTQREDLEKLSFFDIQRIEWSLQRLHFISSELTKFGDGGEGPQTLTWLIAQADKYTVKRIYKILISLPGSEEVSRNTTLPNQNSENTGYCHVKQFQSLLSSFDERSGDIFLKLVEEAQHCDGNTRNKQISLEKFKALLALDPKNSDMLPALLALMQLLKQKNARFLNQNYVDLLKFTDQEVIKAAESCIELLWTWLPFSNNENAAKHKEMEAVFKSIFAFPKKNTMLLKQNIISCLCHNNNLLTLENFHQLLNKPFEIFFHNQISAEIFITSFTSIMHYASQRKLTQGIVNEVAVALQQSEHFSEKPFINDDEDLGIFLLNPINFEDAPPYTPSYFESPTSPRDTSPLLPKYKM